MRPFRVYRKKNIDYYIYMIQSNIVTCKSHYGLLVSNKNNQNFLVLFKCDLYSI